jgi:hypothetical protein
MTPWFIALKTFGPADGGKWADYVAWSGLHQLAELISLDQMLCPTLLPEIKAEYWPHIVNEDYCTHFFTDLAFLRRQVADIAGGRILCVYRNPQRPPVLPVELSSFRLIGYDLVDEKGDVSALSNCAGWPGILDNFELSPKGLIEGHARAVQLREQLARRYPEEPHARCNLWAIFV